jgi:hypothetical protein
VQTIFEAKVGGRSLVGKHSPERQTCLDYFPQAQLLQLPETRETVGVRRRASTTVMAIAAAFGLLTGACSQSSNAASSKTVAHPVIAQPTTQFGVDVLWYYDGTDAPSAIIDKAQTTFQYAKSLGANSVAISFPFYTTSYTSDRIYAARTTPSASQLATVVNVAEKYGLWVTVRPILDETDLQASGKWRGQLQPTNRNAWFASYANFLHPYLVMAENESIPQFDIGVEFDSLSGNSHWTNLVAQARRYYSGEIGYDANWTDAKLGLMGPAAVDRFGIDAYMPIHLPSDASIRKLTTGWENWFRALPRPVDLKDLVVAEVGIPAQDGAFRHPYGAGSSTAPISPAIQAKWFTAACATMRALDMKGIYFWNLSLNIPPGSFNSATAAPLSFVDRGSSAIKLCFKAIQPW